EGTSFPAMMAYQQEAAAIVAADPAVDGFMSSIGSRGGNATATNTGSLFVRLKPKAERGNIDPIIDRLRQKLGAVSGLRCYPQNVPPIRIGGQTSKSQYQYTLRSGDLDALREAAPALAAKMAALDDLQDVTTDLQVRNPQVFVD